MAGFNWQRYEAWRGHPMLNNNLRHAGVHIFDRCINPASMLIKRMHSD